MRHLERHRLFRPAAAVLATLLLLTCTHVTLAQLPATRLTAIFPPGGKAGGEVPVTIHGGDLDECRQLVFSDSRIAAEPLTAPPGVLEATRRIVPNQFVVTIPVDVPPATYEARAIGRFGASNPRAFVVGGRHEVTEDQRKQDGENDVPSRAVPIEVGTTINGRVAEDRVDYYQFTASAGDRILLDCAGRRVDSKIDATLVLYDSQGRELKRLYGGSGPDPVETFEVPADGRYTIGVYDFLYRGGDGFYYRLTLDNYPHVHSVFPPVGRPGSKATYTLYGQNLPGGKPVDDPHAEGWEQVELEIELSDNEQARQQMPVSVFVDATQSGRDGYLHEWESPRGRSNPFCIDFAKAPLVVETEPNDEPASVQRVAVPSECCGQFQQPGDRDWYEFVGHKGEVIWIEVISQSAGSDTDPYLVVQKVTRNESDVERIDTIANLDEAYRDRRNLIYPTFDSRSRDPSFELHVEEDAVYRLMVRNLYAERRGSPRMIYRLLISKSQPDFRLVAYHDPYRKTKTRTSPGALVMRRGDQAALMVHLFRKNGFRGEVRIRAEDLPLGVTCQEAIMTGSAETSALVFTAAIDCPRWTGPVRVVGRASVDGEQVVRQACAGALVWPTADTKKDRPVSRLVRNVWLSVIEKDSTAATVTVGDGQTLETSIGGKVRLPVRVVRHGNFKTPLKLIPAGLPPALKPGEMTLSGEGGTYELTLNHSTVPVGSYTFFLQGTGSRSYARNPQAIAAVEAKKERVVRMRQQIETQVSAATAAKDAAVRHAQDMANHLEQLRKTLGEAQRVQQSARQDVVQNVAKRKTAEDAVLKDAQNQSLVETAKAAQAAAAAAFARLGRTAANLRQIQQAVAVAEQTHKDAETAGRNAEKAVAVEIARRGEVENLVRQVDQEVARVKQKNQTRDVDFAIGSNPIYLRVAESPVTVTAWKPLSGSVVQGEQLGVTVAIQRNYGFDGRVTLKLDAPKRTNGIEPAQVQIDQGADEGKLELKIPPDATPGDYVCKLSVQLRFNGVKLTSTEDIPIRIEPSVEVK